MKKKIFLCFLFLFAVSLIYIQGMEKRKITDDDIFNLKQISQPAFSPDGKWIAYVVTVKDKEKNKSISDVWMIPSQGGEPVRITNNENGDTSPKWSPDGKYLAFLSNRKEKNQIWLFNTKGGEPWQLTNMNNGVRNFTWSPNSSQIDFIAKDPEPEEKEKKKGEKEKPEPIEVDRLQHKRDRVGYLDHKRNHIWLISVKDKESRKLIHGQYDENDIEFSPDGKEIAFSSNRTENADANRNTDIWAINIESCNIRKLSMDKRADSNPSWSHDGQSIAYLGGANPVYGTTFLWTVPTRGGKPVKISASIDRNIRSKPLWSNNDQYIYFILEDSGNLHLCHIPSSGGKIERVISGERTVRNFILSPNGKYIAFIMENFLSPPELYILNSEIGEFNVLTSLNKKLIAELKLSEPENIHYQSFDGEKIEGWVMKPLDFQSGKKYPMIVRAHGGPNSQYSTSFSHEFQLLAAKGYVVLFTNPRGSSGYGEPFGRGIWADWGNKDLKDVLAGVDYILKQGYVDPDRLGIYGWSYGGIMTNYAITRSNRFKAAISGASETDYFSCYGYDDLHLLWEEELGLPWENRDIYWKISPIKDVEKVKTSTLFMCGQFDYRCPLPQTEEMYLRLKRLRIDTKLIIYPGESHGIRNPHFQLDRLKREINWFNKYLKPEN
jgi:dipeptidyl aminopeptidase/acylaminoacyl peptidase